MASSTSQPDHPTLMIGWTGSMAAQDFGAWVIENPTEAQLHIFQEANFPLSEACFAPPSLMEKAGAKFYPNRRDCAAITDWLHSKPPPLLIALGKGGGVKVWVLHNPTTAQLDLFRAANFPIEERALVADPEIMEKAGATLHPDLNIVPEVVSIYFARPTEDQLAKQSRFGWPMTGGVWALIDPTREQYEALKKGGYDFWNYDSEDRYHGLLESVGAKWYANPEEVKDEVEKVSPNFILHPKGTRGGIAA